MKASELRIGNLILRDNDEMVVYHLEKRYKSVWQVNSLDIDFDDQKQIDKLCSPIPLTEEWLVKFGFEKALNGWWDESEFLSIIDCEVVKWHGEYLREIKYVHQLQNLYFTLTDEELIIKS